MANVHPTAIVEEGADLHPSVKVGPYSIIESGAVIGADCVIESQVRIYAQTRMGRGNRICHTAAIGSEPQDLSYEARNAKPLTIGDHNCFREAVTISHGIKEDHGTVVGSHNYLMNNAHIGHDCIVGDHNVFANTALLAGHVHLANHVFLSGHVAIHQFCRIGDHAMVAGVSGVPRDVPPYTLVDGHRAEIVGLNVVGLRRAGFTTKQRSRIKQAYRLLYRSGLAQDEALQQLREQADCEEMQQILEFVTNSPRGLVGHR